LKRANPERFRTLFSVVMENTTRQLNGTLYVEMEEVASPKKQIVSLRSFGHSVTDYNQLAEWMTFYVAQQKIHVSNNLLQVLFRGISELVRLKKTKRFIVTD
jgi:hypothetical protein